jgi:uncharacterized protein (TIGR04255 family)
MRPRRVGVRYLNRFTIPTDQPVGHWLNLYVKTPDVLGEPNAVRVRQSWDAIHGHPGLSATVTLAHVPAKGAAATETGLLLDVDVFSSGVKMDYAGALEFIESAHAAENRVFEACITDQLRERFKG